MNLGVAQLESFERKGDLGVRKLMSLFILLKISLYCVWVGDTKNVHGSLPQRVLNGFSRSSKAILSTLHPERMWGDQEQKARIDKVAGGGLIFLLKIDVLKS